MGFGLKEKVFISEVEMRDKVSKIHYSEQNNLNTGQVAWGSFIG